MFSFTEMCRAVGVRKLQESQKAKSLWKMKAAKDAGEEYYDPTREASIKGRNETRLALREEHLKYPIVALDKALNCLECFGPSAGGKMRSQWLMMASVEAWVTGAGWRRMKQGRVSIVQEIMIRSTDYLRRIIASVGGQGGVTYCTFGDWGEYKSIFRFEVQATESAFDRIKEAFEQVAQDEAEQLSIVQEIVIRSTSRRHDVTVCQHCNSFFWKTTSGGSLEEKGATIGGARSVEKNTIGSNRTGFWSYKQVIVLIRQRFSKHMQYLRAFAQT